MKKIIFLIILCFLIIIDINVEALELNSKYAILYNLNNDEVIYEVNKDQKTSIASLTKIMTTLVAIENIQDYNKKIILKEEMFKGLKEANAAVIGLKNGQKVTYNDLLYGMFLASGADATRAIAISVLGNEEKFVELMNKKAKELNLKNTNFVNTVGLDAQNHYSTVSDVALILKNAFKNQKFKEIFMTDKYTFSDKSITVFSTMRKNANVLNINTDYILGAKTGYTEDAGRCLASIAKDSKNNINYLLVTTNAQNISGPIIDAKSIYDYYFENFKYQTLVKKGDLVAKLPTKYSKTKEVRIYASKDVKKYLNNDYSKDDITVKFEGIDEVTPKVKKNSKIGSVKVFYKDELIDTLNVSLQQTVEFSFIVFIVTHKFIFLCLSIIIIISFLFISKYRSDKSK